MQLLQKLKGFITIKKHGSICIHCNRWWEVAGCLDFARHDKMSKINKAVILAAGRGTRMRELTAELPKPMIEVRGKPVLQHIVEGLRDAGIREFLIVVGYRGDALRNFLGTGSRYDTAIQYTTQTVQDGTGRVVDLGRDFVRDTSFVLSYGDILVDPANYKRVVELPDGVEAIITLTRGEDLSKGGAVLLNDEMELVDIREKSDQWSGLSRDAAPFYNAGLYAFRPSIFDFTATLKLSPRGEYELTDAIRELAQSGKKVKALQLTGEWADVRDPEVLAKLNAQL
jgi:dTDP-glucose pyrophosphorylase